MSRLLLSGLLVVLFKATLASNGDRSDYFLRCLDICMSDFCSTETDWFIDGRPKPLTDVLVRWTCRDECGYECMWKATDLFLDRGWKVPQFYGKWPFIRIWGFQEPASALFSLLNLLANVYMIRKFRRKVRPDSPNYYVWHVFAAVCCNGWVWSFVFHTRDLPVTELLDYGFAYSMVLTSLVCMVLRMLNHKSVLLRGLIAIGSALFFFSHFYYLSLDKFDYQYNMKINIITGIVGGIGWLIWYVVTRKKRIYAWKVLAFQVFAGFSLVLEVNDFPPLYYSIDAHSLWHLSSMPLTILFYNFIIDDTISLRAEKYEQLLIPPMERKKVF